MFRIGFLESCQGYLKIDPVGMTVFVWMRSAHPNENGHANGITVSPTRAAPELVIANHLFWFATSIATVRGRRDGCDAGAVRSGQGHRIADPWLLPRS